MNKLNTYLANLALWNAKLHNLHWNVTGHAFVQVHEFTEKLYDDVFEQYDAVAEIMKMQNIMPLVKLSDMLKNATLSEVDGRDYSVAEILKIVEDDIKAMAALAVEIRNEAVATDNFQVVSQFEDYINAYAKNLWFLRAMQK